MTAPIVETTFDFHSETPPGKDADAVSPTLRKYHQILWSKLLPSGVEFTLTREPGSYLVHRSELGVFHLSSDAITTKLRDRAAGVIAEVPPADLPEDLGYTVGSAILFPGVPIERKMTINGARGFHPRIADRFDLTLECIRRHYLGEPSPLADPLQRYADFFGLFGTFNGYVEFFLLQDLVDGHGQIRFFHTFDDFTAPAVPTTVETYLSFAVATNDFIRARNQRIDTWANPLS